MYHGRYFRLDTDAANIEKGIAVFRYCQDGKTDCGTYVTFSDDEITFYFNSRVDDTIKDETILHIPIDDNIDRGFASIVTEAFHSTINDVSAISREELPPSYDSTFSFAASEKSAQNRKKPRSASEWLPVRRLILDFLFDLKETRVFEMSPHYGELTEKLHHNFFARCLIAKAGYWYHRILYENAVRESDHAFSANNRKTRKNKRQFYGAILFQAEKEWTDCIRDYRSDKIFHDEFNGWFDDSETEMQRIYLPYLPIALSDGVAKKLKKENDNNTSKWFVTRHAALTAWYILLVGNRSFWDIHLIRPRILFAIAVGWITIGGMSELVSSKNDTGLLYPISLTVVIFAVSLLLIWRVVPLVKDISIRALRFSCYVLLASSIAGAMLSPMIGKGYNLTNICLTAVIGLVVQIFLQGGNPNEPL